MKADDLQAQRLRKEFEERISADRKTVRCPMCDELHALWYRMGVKDKKSLVFTCNKQKHIWHEVLKDHLGKPVIDDRGEPVVRECFRIVTKTFEAPVFIDGLPIYVDWTPQKRSEHQKKNQYQLPIPTSRK